MPQLQMVREHIALNSRKLKAIVTAPAFRRAVGALEGERLQRVPRGFPKDHEAAEYLKHRQFLAGASFRRPSRRARSSTAAWWGSSVTSRRSCGFSMSRY